MRLLVRVLVRRADVLEELFDNFPENQGGSLMLECNPPSDPPYWRLSTGSASVPDRNGLRPDATQCESPCSDLCSWYGTSRVDPVDTTWRSAPAKQGPLGDPDDRDRKSIAAVLPRYRLERTQRSWSVARGQGRLVLAGRRGSRSDHHLGVGPTSVSCWPQQALSLERGSPTRGWRSR